jgi:hypothetical protein
MACDSVSRIYQWLLADGNESGARPINIKDQQDHGSNQNAHGIYWQSPAAAFSPAAVACEGYRDKGNAVKGQKRCSAPDLGTRSDAFVDYRTFRSTPEYIDLLAPCRYLSP